MTPEYQYQPKTSLQQKIESLVTNGLGYDSVDLGSLFYLGDEFESRKNTPSGLQAHLGKMDYKLNPSDTLLFEINGAEQAAEKEAWLNFSWDKTYDTDSQKYHPYGFSAAAA